MITASASTADFRGLFGPGRPFLGATGGLRPSTHQGAPRKIEIGQTDQREHLHGVLRDLVVSYLCAADLALYDPKRVLDPHAARGHIVVEGLARLGQ